MQSHTILKKIHKHMDVKVLKSILNLIKKEKTKNRKIDINILDNLISKFIIKEEKVVDLEINKN